MSDAYVGEIRMFAGTYAPDGWLKCDGTLLSVASNEYLFSVLGTTYGGNGVSTFAVPDLRGRLPIHVGQGPGLSPKNVGESLGVESVTLTENQMPSHAHVVYGTSELSSDRPAKAYPGTGGSYGPGSSGAIASAKTTATGGNQPHENRQPSLAISFIICLYGIYPERQ